MSRLHSVQRPIVNGETIIEEIRAIKSKEEIEAIREAVKITELGIEVAIKTIEPGVKESEVVLEAEYAMRKAGGRIPFRATCLGQRSCLAHHVSSTRSLKGTRVDPGHPLRLSRVIVQTLVALWPAERSIENIRMNLVWEQEESGPGRDHGVGIMNSEVPCFMFPHQDKGYPEILETNMVVAVSNIGLYSGQGWGVRVEDTALVTENEPVKLTRFPKALVIK